MHAVMKRALAAPLALALFHHVGGAVPVQEPHTPTFTGGVDLVTVSVVVNNHQGRPVVGLSRQDFDLFDAGQARAIVDFRSEPAPVSVAILLDASGSMKIGRRWSEAREAIAKLAAELNRDGDRIALFTFDTGLHDVQPFTSSPADAIRRLEDVRPWGSTALYDAIAQTGRQVAAQGRSRRAVVVVTDGIDNRSHSSAADVSAVASALDTPVYSVVVASTLDRHDDGPDGDGSAVGLHGTLEDLSRWTGGALFVSSAPTEAGEAARKIVAELRHQYLMTFEPSAPAGWHPLLVRVHQGDFVARTRRGYVAGPRASGQH